MRLISFSSYCTLCSTSGGKLKLLLCSLSHFGPITLNLNAKTDEWRCSSDGCMQHSVIYRLNRMENKLRVLLLESSPLKIFWAKYFCPDSGWLCFPYLLCIKTVERTILMQHRWKHPERLNRIHEQVQGTTDLFLFKKVPSIHLWKINTSTFIQDQRWDSIFS